MTKNRLIAIVASLRSSHSKREEEEEEEEHFDTTMNTQMGSALGQGYWSYIEGAHIDQPIETAPEYATWVQAARR